MRLKLGEELRMELAERLRHAREHAGLSQAQAAKILNLHRPTLSTIEAGKRKVTVEELADFARVYQVSTSWLLGENDDKGSLTMQLAARELSKLKDEDVNILLKLLSSLKTGDGS